MTSALIEDDVLRALADRADRADAEPAWPAASWDVLRGAGVLAWSIPTAYGGRGLDPVALLGGYERLAGACLTTTFLLSQREAAVRRLCDFARAETLHALLPPLARGEGFVTVGLSQLTTSRQHQAPALVAVPDAGGYRLDGVIPWVTGAARADVLVIGATLADGRQLLLALPCDREGVTVEPPLELCALLGSQTAQIRLQGVRVAAGEVIAGPAERVLSAGKAGGGLETSCLALGLAGAAVEHLQSQAGVRPDLRSVAERFAQARREVRGRLHQLARGEGDAAAVIGLRVRANRLVLQATQAALTVSKGTGFVRPHPAQLWARQALFFLVWSCPRPAAEGVLGYLLPEVENRE
jgi:alkylation response protein AidB-like acyl-CoA dehydrogenase